ncbi:unnamed protein product [Meganyctiphanes norvegica]|uniref:Uncharacterized protein n=1 Tax=Meganyctiphanes norvegica TaxID=48144 RepID=A0AAV2PM59_MEGNR
MTLQQKNRSSSWILWLLLFIIYVRASDVDNQNYTYEDVVNNCLEEDKFTSSLNTSLATSTELLRGEIQEVREKILEAYRDNKTLLILKEDIQSQSKEIMNALTNIAGSDDVQLIKLQISNMSQNLNAGIEQIIPKFTDLVDKSDFEILNDAIFSMATNKKVELISNKIDGLSTKQMINNINDLLLNMNNTLYSISDVTLKEIIDNVHKDLENNSISIKDMHKETISHIIKVATKDSIDTLIDQIGILATNKSVQDVLDKLSLLPNNETVFKLKENVSNDVQFQNIRDEITQHFGKLDQRLSDIEKVFLQNFEQLKQMLSNLPDFQIDIEEISEQRCNSSAEPPVLDKTSEDIENILSQYLHRNQVFEGVPLNIIDLVVISLVAVMIILLCVVLKLLCSIKSKVSHLEHQKLHKSYYEQGSPLLSRMDQSWLPKSHPLGTT